MSNTFGDVLKRIRSEKGLSQRQIAIKYGIIQGKEHGATTSHIAAWEYGSRKPRRKSIDLLVLALHLTDAEHAELLIAAGFMPENQPSLHEAFVLLKERIKTSDFTDETKSGFLKFVEEVELKGE